MTRNTWLKTQSAASAFMTPAEWVAHYRAVLAVAQDKYAAACNRGAKLGECQELYNKVKLAEDRVANWVGICMLYGEGDKL